jgi:tetratricopeptide (TPR) repeat protein
MLHNIWKGLFMVQVDTIQAGNTVDTVVKTVKERSNMVKAREAIHLTQWEVARACLVDVRTVRGWENATHTPYLRHIGKLRDILKWTGTDAKLLEVFDMPVEETQDKEVAEPCHVQTNRGILDSSDSTDVQESEEGLVSMDKGRRELNSTIAASIIAAGTGVALVSSTRILTAPMVEADEYLDVVRDSINNWWRWLDQGNYSELEAKLNRHVPVLKQIATTVSPFQKQAARLAVQAKIMQVNLANLNLEFSQRESYCMEAIQMGTLSGDKNLLALAQWWHGDTFTYCYNEPQTAIELLNKALKNVANIDGNPLIATKIYIDLSISHAQKGDETNALVFAEMARSTMPEYPVLDPLYESIGFGLSELDQYEGKTYLYLAEHLNSRSYAEKARTLFDKSTDQQAVSKGYQIQGLIRKADASRLLGNMHKCTNTLRQAYENTSSVHRLTQINDVLHRVPKNWQKETSVQNLRDELSHALIVARR